MRFHSRTGTLVNLNNGGKTAKRNHASQEFNNGVVLSAETLINDKLFEVRIDKKINSWSGSIEIGVTTCDPANLNFPNSAAGLREGTWVMSGCAILKDGLSYVEDYGPDLDQLGENDRVGVLRTSSGELHFYVNSVDQGVAASSIPSKIYAVIDMYGKCAQITIMDNSCEENSEEHVTTNDERNEAIAQAESIPCNDRLSFHERCGSLIKLTNERLTGERMRPLDEFNNGVLMTNRPLKDDELFEIRLDTLVDKWSGSIEVGLTTHNPGHLEFPATMTNMRSGKWTVMMSGCGILTNGKGTRREYGEYNLDELHEGDRIGMMRKSNGALHYYINGHDQGVASPRTPQTIWGVIDLYGMAVKVSIVSNGNIIESPQSPQESSSQRQLVKTDIEIEPLDSADNSTQNVPPLTFHEKCGAHASVLPNSTSVHRPKALLDFNKAVVLTDRMLQLSEIFEVRIDKMVSKWAGSIEIGVTTHSPSELDFPSTMTNMRSGTWMMTGNGVMHNGTTVIDHYGQNLDILKENDRVAVLRKADGTLHFFVNSIDQGVAATNVPANIYGVIDLYGQAAKASIIQHSDTTCSIEKNFQLSVDDLKFHNFHGKNAVISNNGRTASRPCARGEFNDAIIVTNRPLRRNEFFEVLVEKMVDRWSGSIEAGITVIVPEEVEFPNTMTDLESETWMLSGSSLVADGNIIQKSYSLDLDSVSVGSKIGMELFSDGSLHYFLDGIDKGVAFCDIPGDVYAAIDLYGQCAQVSICSGSFSEPPMNHSFIEIEQTLAQITNEVVHHKFSSCCGKHISLKNNSISAHRIKTFGHGLLFSSNPLHPDEIFEVKIEKVNKLLCGTLQIGLTTHSVCDSTSQNSLPTSLNGLKNKVTWFMSDHSIKKNQDTLIVNYGPSLDRLMPGSKIGVKKCSDGSMHIIMNGEDLGIAASNVPKNVFAILDLHGSVMELSVTSQEYIEMNEPSIIQSILDYTPFSDNTSQNEFNQDLSDVFNPEFHSHHGKNIELSKDNLTACRSSSFNNGIIVSHYPIPQNYLFKFRIDNLSSKWTSSLFVGVVEYPGGKLHLPVTALNIAHSSWIIHGDSVFHNAIKIKDEYGPNLNNLKIGDIVGILINSDGCLNLYINGADQGVAAKNIAPTCYLLIDLYGKCEQISVLTENCEQTHQNQDYREKADIEDGVKEKQNILYEGPHVKNCEYQNMCSRFKATLGLPEGYFNPLYNRCYCDLCQKSRGYEAYSQKGDPPKDYAVPFGWCKFSLRIPAKAEALSIFDKWHVAYHSVNASSLRGILDTGDLKIIHDTFAGHILMPKPVCFDEKNCPDEEHSTTQISLSPTLRYIGKYLASPRMEFKDLKTKKNRFGQIAIQVCVKPGSYKIGAPSVLTNGQIDPYFDNNEVEWLTKEHGATVITALLIKIE